MAHSAQLRLSAYAPVFFILVIGCSTQTGYYTKKPTSSDVVNNVADEYRLHVLRTNPEAAYFSGVELERHDGLRSNRLDDIARSQTKVDSLLRVLRSVDGDSLLGDPAWITYVYLLEELENQVGTRVCRTELWNVNQMGGWQSGYVRIAQQQPVGTSELRSQSLARWSQFSDLILREIENLKTGLALGYSAPKTVVQRVVDQVEGLIQLGVEESPFYSPARRDDNNAFKVATRELVAKQILPALKQYRNYLAGPYMEGARAELSITANPNGAQCYEASLRSYTTLDRPAKAVYDLGKRTVEANRITVIKLGEETYGLSGFKQILRQAKEDPQDRFSSKDELLAFSRESVERAEKVMPKWIGLVPDQPVEVVPFEEHEEGTGRSAHYRPGSDERPGEYRIPLHKPEEQSRGKAESTAFHEAWPGHHLQMAVAKASGTKHPVTDLIWFSGPGEGWARYSEALAEEMGLYTTKTGPITRRAWPARGMVVDPGVHLYGWTREQAIEFMMESGRFPESMGDQLVDRIAILPGQLTAYDSGGLEIIALRQQAERVLGDNFDISEFHDRILENGSIPLPALRVHIERWLERSTLHSDGIRKLGT